MTDAFVQKRNDSQKMTREQKIIGGCFSHDNESRIHLKTRRIKFVVITQQSLLSRSSSRKRAMQETSRQKKYVLAHHYFCLRNENRTRQEE